jgi:hypothetical protein
LEADYGDVRILAGCDSDSRFCDVVNGLFVDMCVGILIVSVVVWVFWRLRWWPISRVRERAERVDAEFAARRAQDARAKAATNSQTANGHSPEDTPDD